MSTTVLMPLIAQNNKSNKSNNFTSREIELIVGLGCGIPLFLGLIVCYFIFYVQMLKKRTNTI